MIGMVIIVLWLISGIIGYGLTFAAFQRKWLDLADAWYYNDMLMASISLVAGPIGILAMMVTFRTFKYGFKFW